MSESERSWLTAESKQKQVIKTRSDIIETFYDFLTKTDKRILAIYGGAGSGKSYQVALYLLMLFFKERVKILCTRKTFPSLRITSYQLIRDILSSWGAFQIGGVRENKAEHILSYKNSTMLFKSLDDPEKIKSFEADMVWIEEATELSREDFLHLNLRLTRTNPNVKLIMTFNPIDAFHWLITDVVQGNDSNVAIHHSTYKDNPFLDETFIRQLRELEHKDLNFYRIYTLGEPGVLEHIIYSNYHIANFDEWPIKVRANEPQSFGIDFGFNDPNVIIAAWEYDKRTYIKEALYKTGQTVKELIAYMNAHNLPKNIPYYCDSSRPEMIEEISRAGFNAKPVEKGKDSVKFGIDSVKSRQLIISADSINTIKEIRGYKYIETKDGRVLDEPVDAMNHAMDAMRYALTPIRAPDSKRFRTFVSSRDW